MNFSKRDSNVFTVSVSVDARRKVTFNLTYEELLVRSLGTYHHVINIDPGQVVLDMSVRVTIQESSRISYLQVPVFRTTNEVLEDISGKQKLKNDIIKSF
jgi:Vault protein inter-alpha-trypsin.